MAIAMPLARSEGILARLGILAGAKGIWPTHLRWWFRFFSNSDLVYSGLSSPQAAQCIFPCCAFFRRFLKIIFHVFFFFLVFWSFFGNGDEIFSMSQRPTFDGFVLVSYFYLFRFALSVTKLASTAFAAPLSQRSRRRCWRRQLAQQRNASGTAVLILFHSLIESIKIKYGSFFSLRIFFCFI